MSDDARRIILARRARFVAAAVASIGIACGKEKVSPTVCLSVSTVVAPDASSPPPDAATATGEDGGSTITPAPCLSVPAPRDAGPPPQPQPCLRVKAPTQDDGKF